VFNMQQTEAGIDGIIELNDPQTGAATACFLGVQVKTTEQFDAESPEKFSFYVDGDDLKYWNSSAIPVVLVVCRARSDEGYAVVIQDYFKSPDHRNTKTVVFNKAADRFQGDQSWSRRLLGIGVPHSRGLAFPPMPIAEDLSSNLLEAVLPKTVYYGSPKLKSRAEILAELRNQNFDGHEFFLKDSMIWTVHSLYNVVWSGIVENLSIKPMDFNELAFHEDQARRRYAVEMLNLCLSARLRNDEVYWFREEEMYVYSPKRQITQRVRKAIQTEESETKRGLIFPTWYKGRIVRCRHLAMVADFVETGGTYYLQVDPTYYFSREGKKKHPRWEELIRAARILQKEQDYHNNLEVWRGLLTAQPDLARPEYLFLQFKDYRRFSAPVSIPDEVWRPKGANAENADLDQKLLDLFQ
jgi:hypothetical protein